MKKFAMTPFLNRREQKLHYDLARLKLEYVFNVVAAGERSFADALFTQTTFFIILPPVLEEDQPGVSGEQKALWRKFSDRLEELFRKNQVPAQGAERGSRRRDAFVRTFLDAATPMVYPLVVQAELYKRMTVRERWFGCFRYDFQTEQGSIHLHFRNACAPASPFANVPGLFASLKEMVSNIESKGLPARTIACGSWINNLAPFQALFPPSYKSSLKPTTPDNKMGDGWWGQFTSRTGVLHRPRAELLRKEWRFEFPRLHGDCSFASFSAHVEKNAAAIEPKRET